MTDIAATLTLDAIATHQRQRLTAISSVLDTHPAGTDHTGTDHTGLPLAYALAAHQLEGAERAARQHDETTMNWYRHQASHAFAPLTISTDVGARVVVAPPADQMITGPHSETPYYILSPATSPAPDPVNDLVRAALINAGRAGLADLVHAHAAVICLTGERRINQTLRSFAITRLPSTVFTDHTSDPAVLGRDIVHEAAHNWLNDALAALNVTLPEDRSYFSPWRSAQRPAFGFLHACFAFPMTLIYAVEALTSATGPAATLLNDHIRQQRTHLEKAEPDFQQAVELVTHRELRIRLTDVYQTAIRL
jgi:hypothetical protein